MVLTNMHSDLRFNPSFGLIKLLTAKDLGERLIIVQAWWALVGS